jgi:hypothetical protein
MFVQINRMQDSIKKKIANRYFEIVAKYTYLGTTLTNQNCNYKKKNSDQITYRESLLQFSHKSFVFQFYNDIKTEIYRIVILAAVLCGLGTWSLILSEKYRHRMLRIGC